MKAFVFEYLDQVSSAYHSGGGLVVIAADEDAARARIADESEVGVRDEEWVTAIVYDLAGEPEPRVFIFPDAGCC